jgi:Uma2 family endonuclease
VALSVSHKLFNNDEYDQMIKAGILKESDRVELIRGEILHMAPISLRHSVCVTRLEALFHESLGRRVVVWGQNPIRLPDNSQPQPDVALLKWRDDFYAGKQPGPEDVLLLVEVADTSLAFDRKFKVPLYAETGIQLVWLVNLSKNIVQVYEMPAGSAYQDFREARKGEELTLPGFNVTFSVNDILG